MFPQRFPPAGPPRPSRVVRPAPDSGVPRDERRGPGRRLTRARKARRRKRGWPRSLASFRTRASAGSRRSGHGQLLGRVEHEEPDVGALNRPGNAEAGDDEQFSDIRRVEPEWGHIVVRPDLRRENEGSAGQDQACAYQEGAKSGVFRFVFGRPLGSDVVAPAPLRSPQAKCIARKRTTLRRRRRYSPRGWSGSEARQIALCIGAPVRRLENVWVSAKYVPQLRLAWPRRRKVRQADHGESGNELSQESDVRFAKHVQDEKRADDAQATDERIAHGRVVVKALTRPPPTPQKPQKKNPKEPSSALLVG